MSQSRISRLHDGYLFRSSKRLLGAVDVTDRLLDWQAPVDVVEAAAVVVVVVAVDSASDAAAAVIAVAVAAGMPVADDDCDCDYDCGFAVFSGSRIVAYKDRVLAGPVPVRFLPVEVRSAGYDLLSQGRAVVEVACYDNFERSHGSSTYVASASGVRPLPAGNHGGVCSIHARKAT